MIKKAKKNDWQKDTWEKYLWILDSFSKEEKPKICGYCGNANPVKAKEELTLLATLSVIEKQYRKMSGYNVKELKEVLGVWAYSWDFKNDNLEEQKRKYIDDLAELLCYPPEIIKQ